MNLRFLSVILFYFPLSIFFFIFFSYLWDNYRTLLITVLFIRTDRLSCINIRVIIIIIFDKRSYFSLCSVSFVRFRRIHYITPHYLQGAICMRMRQYGLWNFLRIVYVHYQHCRLFSGAEWRIRSTKVFFKVSRYFYGESEVYCSLAVAH